MEKYKKYIPYGIIAFIVLYIGGTYNSLISKQLFAEKTWGQVETTYQARFDLVPSLVSIVKESADFEKDTLTEITAARSAWAQAGSINQKVAAANSFDSALSRLLVSVENYPTLTATRGFQSFQSQIEGVENRIRVARMDYNDSTLPYNKKLMRFPSNIIANLFGFEELELFKAAQGAEEAVNIKDLFNE